MKKYLIILGIIILFGFSPKTFASYSFTAVENGIEYVFTISKITMPNSTSTGIKVQTDKTFESYLQIGDTTHGADYYIGGSSFMTGSREANATTTPFPETPNQLRILSTDFTEDIPAEYLEEQGTLEWNYPTNNQTITNFKAFSLNYENYDLSKNLNVYLCVNENENSVKTPTDCWNATSSSGIVKYNYDMSVQENSSGTIYIYNNPVLYEDGVDYYAIAFGIEERVDGAFIRNYEYGSPALKIKFTISNHNIIYDNTSGTPNFGTLQQQQRAKALEEIEGLSDQIFSVDCSSYSITTTTQAFWAFSIPWFWEGTIPAINCYAKQTLYGLGNVIFMPSRDILNYLKDEINNFTTNTFPFSLANDVIATTADTANSIGNNSTSSTLSLTLNSSTIPILTPTMLDDTIGTTTKNQLFYIIKSAIWISAGWLVITLII